MTGACRLHRPFRGHRGTPAAGRHAGTVLPPPGTPGTDLPVRAVLPALEAALRSAGGAVLGAPPGTGETSLVPLAVAGAGGGGVVAGPRGVAARAAAGRRAALVGEPVGGAVGYSVRVDSRRSAAT